SRRAELGERAVAMARRLGDRAGLAYALHAQSFAMSAPGNAEDRITVATELVRVSEAMRDSQMEFQGHFWRVFHPLELGDAPALEAEYQACVRIAEPRDPYQLWHVVALKAMRALIAGRCDDAYALVTELQSLAQRWSPSFVEILIGQILTHVARQRGH